MDRRTIKLGMLRALRHAGAHDMAKNSGWRSRRLLILGYHGISLEDEHEWNPALFMSPAAFRSRLEAIAREGFTVLPLEDAVRRLYAGELPPRALVMTFDDGFHNFQQAALPLLAEFGFPSTLYLTTFYCRYNEPLFLLSCSYLLWKRRHRPAALDKLLDVPRGLVLEHEAARGVVLAAIRRKADDERWMVEDQTQFIRDLSAALELDYDQWAAKRLLHLLNPAEVRAVAEQGVTMGLHMHYHYSPPQEEDYIADLQRNRREVLALAGHVAPHFCYPSGNWRPEFRRWLSAEGIKTGMTCDAGLASDESDPMVLPRVLDHQNMSLTEFQSWLAGTMMLLSFRKGAVGAPAH
jgi:peptidoglycan/xylan/chitin deacetylase (PgdA/CDA1 family)